MLPFFEAAVDDEPRLETMWRQTVNYYLEGPLPPLFKERLAAVLAREHRATYCLACHTSTLRALGMTPDEVTALLLDTKYELRAPLATLRAQAPLGTDEWPAPGTVLEDALFYSAVHLSHHPHDEEHHAELIRVLGRERYYYLFFFLDYCKMCMEWVKQNPSINYQADPRVREGLAPLLAGSSGLRTFLSDYGIE